MRHSNCNLMREPNYRAYTMGTYSSSFWTFAEQLRFSFLPGQANKSDAAHFGVGLSHSKDSWRQAPNSSQVRQRFCALRLAGVEHIALFGGEFIDPYVPFLAGFVARRGVLSTCL